VELPDTDEGTANIGAGLSTVGTWLAKLEEAGLDELEAWFDTMEADTVEVHAVLRPARLNEGVKNPVFDTGLEEMEREPVDKLHGAETTEGGGAAVVEERRSPPATMLLEAGSAMPREHDRCTAAVDVDELSGQSQAEVARRASSVSEFTSPPSRRASTSEVCDVSTAFVAVRLCPPWNKSWPDGPAVVPDGSPGNWDSVELLTGGTWRWSRTSSKDSVVDRRCGRK